MIKHASVVALTVIVALGVSCTGNPMSPTPPSATTGGSAAANSDGSTLKVTAPTIFTPFDSERVETRRPALIWGNSSGSNTAVGLAYELEVVNVAGTVLYTRIVGETPGTGSHIMDLELAFNTQYSWRIRARLEAEAGPWSVWGNFVTPLAPVVTTAPTTNDGTIGPPRKISPNEAAGMVVGIHNGAGINLGSSSTRDYRINFIFAAVATMHYGHARWNPKGPDNDWCVKDAGGGRPPSDDVIVICSTRDAWDLVSSSGANNYGFHFDYLGRLPSIQNVYPPGRSSLNFLPK